MPYRTRARRLKPQTVLVDEGPGRLVLPGEEVPKTYPSPYKPPDNRYIPSPDDVMGARSYAKWANRFWNMLQHGASAGSDAMIPVVGRAYEAMLEGYHAVEEALRLYKSGYEAYDYYRAKAERFKRMFPDAPPPPVDVGLPDLPEGVEVPSGWVDGVTGDIVPQNDGYVPQNDGYVPQNDGYVPQNDGYVPQNDGYVPQNDGYVPQNDGYVPRFPPGYAPGRGAARAGGGRKIDFITKYYYE